MSKEKQNWWPDKNYIRRNLMEFVNNVVLRSILTVLFFEFVNADYDKLLIVYVI